MWKYWTPYLKEPFVRLHPKGRRYNSNLKQLHQFSDKIIELKRAKLNNSNVDHKLSAIKEGNSEKKRLSFLDLVMEAKENQHTVSDSDLKALVSTFTMAVSICGTEIYIPEVIFFI